MAALPGISARADGLNFYRSLNGSIENRHLKALSRVEKVGKRHISDDWPATWQECALRLSLGVALRILLRHAAWQAGHLDSIVRVQEQGQ